MIFNKRLSIHVLFNVRGHGQRHGILNNPRTNIIMIIIQHKVLLVFLHRLKKLSLVGQVIVTIQIQMINSISNIRSSSGGGTRVLRAAKGEMMEHKVKLGLGVLNLLLQVADDAVAASDRVGGARIGLEDDGAHGLILGAGIEILDDLGDVADAKELVGV